ncbi:hypothetical protein ACFW96_35110 [Streptomyces gardneri]|uniref:hypothetical protein n=1 Tax=Streptomyces gardneri TaxID=66892 RepID=UPI003681E7E3
MERIEISAEDAKRLRDQAEEERLERPALAAVMLEIAGGIDLRAYEPYDKIRERRGLPLLGYSPPDEPDP